MDDSGTLVDCPFKNWFDDCLKKFEIVYSPWTIFVNCVNQT